MIGAFIAKYALAGLGVLLALALAWGGAQTLRLGRAERALATERLAASQASDKAKQATIDAVNAARQEEQRRVEAQAIIARDAATQLARAKSDADFALRASDGLRQRARLLAASCGGSAGNPAPAAGGEAASAPVDMLVGVLARIDDIAGQLAEAADKARIAGLACEDSYDALRKP